jgi:alcohol dehydrogenase (cytochrome c)
LSIIAGALIVAGAAVGGVLYSAFPVQVATIGGLSRNFLTTLGAPAGTVSTEANAAYQAPAAATSSALTDATSPDAASGEWPSYNRTVTSQRYSHLGQINRKNVGQLKVLCTYDTHELAAFESGLIMVDNALIGTTEFDIFSLNPATCAENWRTHENYPPSLLPSNRGAAYMDGLLFRGTQDGRALAYDFKTGKRLWQTTIADTKLGESVPAAPIAYDGLVYIGNSGGDLRGGLGGANARAGGNLYSDSVVVLDSKTGDYKNHFKLVPHDWHDWDVSTHPDSNHGW